MNTKIPSLALSAGLLLASVGAAFAEDVYVYSDGSTKDYSAGMPVPAPVPIPMHEARWYLRLDIGGSIVGNVDEETNDPGVIPRGADEMETSIFGEGGFGYRFNKHFRVDFTSSFHDASAWTERDIVTYSTTLSAPTTADPTVTATNEYDVGREDHVDLKHMSTNLVNFYFDLDKHSGFTPYVGVGVGVTYLETKRRALEVAICQDGYLTPPGPGVPAGCQPEPGAPIIVSSASTEESEWLFSGALMAGFSYDINETFALDAGYRLLYSPGTVQRQAPTLTGTSEVSWTDFLHHQFRTGLRINLF